MERKEKILLHACCAPCSPHVIKTLRQDYDPTIYFYNPNIYPASEYEKRRLEVEGYVRSLGLAFFAGEYDANRWHYITNGLENEREGGARCEICFTMRLNQIACFAAAHKFKWFATTMTVSPHKNSRLINRICRHLARDYQINFLDVDFKKNDGFKISMHMAKELDFYCQKYCGCMHSLRDSREYDDTREDIFQETRNMRLP
jgi:predicted adenine nucleotide alpha hydrolase (AANH) superfamily ATPase